MSNTLSRFEEPTVDYKWITLRVVDKQLELSNLGNQCICCGSTTSDKIRVTLEDDHRIPAPGPVPRLFGRIAILVGRIKGEVPVCSKCIKLRADLSRKIRAGCGISFAIMALLFGCLIFLPKTIKPTPFFIVAIALAIWPVRRSMTFWAAKDRFPFVDFRRLNSEHVSVETVTIDWRDLDS